MFAARAVNWWRGGGGGDTVLAGLKLYRGEV